MNHWKKDLGFIALIGIILYYGAPLLSKILPADTGFLITLACLVLINPTFAFISSVIFTKRNGFNLYLPILLGILFIPAVYLIYNSTALVYIAIYIGTAFIGSGISYTMYYHK